MGDIKISAHCTLFIWGAAAGARKKSELYSARRRREKGHCGIMVMQPACVISPRGWNVQHGKKDRRRAGTFIVLCSPGPFLCAPAAARYSSPLVEALKSNYTCLIAATIAQLVTTGSAFLK